MAETKPEVMGGEFILWPPSHHDDNGKLDSFVLVFTLAPVATRLQARGKDGVADAPWWTRELHD